MGLEMPDEVKWLLPIVVGESWPEGDEDKLRELRDAWTQTAEAIPPVVDAGNAAAREVLASWTGESAQAFEAAWKKLIEGDQAAFTLIENTCNSLAQACDRTALDVEHTKYMIIAALILLAIQIAAMVAAAFVSFGASTAGVVPAQLATRAAVQMVFRQLVQKLMQQGIKEVVKEGLEKILKEGLEKLSQQGLKQLGGAMLKNAGAEMAMDAGVQGLQAAQGNRSSWDWGKTGEALAGGVAGGAAAHVVGPGRGVAGDAAGSVLGHGVAGAAGAAARGAAEGALGAVGGAALTGDLGSMSAGDVLMGASGGAVDGGVGGAKDGFNAATDASRAASAATSAAEGATSAANGIDSGGDEASAPAPSTPDSPVGSPGSGDQGGSTSSASSTSDAPSGGSSSPSGGSEGGGSPSGVGGSAPSGGGSAPSGGSDGGSASSAGGSDVPSTPSATSAASAATVERPDTSYGSAPAGGAAGFGGGPGAGGQHSGGPGGGPGAPGTAGTGGVPGGGVGGPMPGGGMAGSAAGGGFPGQPAGAPSGAPQRGGDFAPQGGGRPGGFAPPPGGSPQAVGPMHSGPSSPPGAPPPQGGPAQQGGFGPQGPSQQGPGHPPQGYQQHPQQGQGQPGQGAPPRGGPHAPQGAAPAAFQPGPAGPNQMGGPQPQPRQQGPGPNAFPPQGAGGFAPPPAGFPGAGPGAQQPPARPPQPMHGQPHPPQAPPTQGGFARPHPDFSRQGPAPQGPHQGRPPQSPPGPSQGSGVPPQQGPPGQHAPQAFAPGQAAPTRPQPQNPPGTGGQQAVPGQSGGRPGDPRGQQSQHRPQERSQQAPAEQPVASDAAPAPEGAPQRSDQTPPHREAPPADRQVGELTPDSPPSDALTDRRPGESAPEQTPADSQQVAEQVEQDRTADDERQEEGHSEADEAKLDEFYEEYAGETGDDELYGPGETDADVDLNDLSFCFDPDYRAPREAFEALEQRLASTPAEDQNKVEEDRWLAKHGRPRTRLDQLMEIVHQRLQESPELGESSKRGALAAHAYTRNDVYRELNAASRKGTLTADQRLMLQAIVSGMNEQPRFEGRMSRGMNFGGGLAAAEVVAGQYEVGQIAVETSIASFSMETETHKDPHYQGEFELRVDSKTARRIQELAREKGEREGTLVPGSQLLVKSKELVDYTVETSDGTVLEKQKWLVEAEEIAPGDPRFLPPDEVERLISERRERARVDEAALEGAKRSIKDKLDPEGASAKQSTSEGRPTETSTDQSATSQGLGTRNLDQVDGSDSSERVASVDGADSGGHRRLDLDSRPSPAPEELSGDGGAQGIGTRNLDAVDGSEQGARTEAPAEERDSNGLSKIENLMIEGPNPGAQPAYEGAHGDVPNGYGNGNDDVPPMPVEADGRPAWQVLAQSTPITSLPAIHGATAHPAHQAAYVVQNHPELGAVNPNYDRPNAYQDGLQTNCTRCVVSYAKRLMGFDVQAEPVLPSELASKGTLPWVQQQLGSQWESHGNDYDSVIRRMSQQPVGSHAVIGVQYQDPNGRVFGHVAMVSNTPHGVAFIDPQTGGLMNLPHPPVKLDLLPFGSLSPEGTPRTAEATSGEQAAKEEQQPRVPERSTTPQQDSTPESDSADPVDEPAPADDEAADQQDASEGAEDGEGHDRSDAEEDADERAPSAHEDEVDRENAGDVRRSGPWMGQHVNPFRPTIEREEDTGPGPLPGAEVVPPIGPLPPGGSTPVPNTPGPDSPGARNQTLSGSLDTGGVPAEAPAFGGVPATGRLPGMPDLPDAPRPGWQAPGTGEAPHGDPSGGRQSGALGPSGAPSATSPSSGGAGAPGAGAAGAGAMPSGPSEPGGAAGVGSGGGQSQQPSGGGAAGQASSSPMGGVGGGPQGRGAGDSERERWRAGDGSSVTHNREASIPADVAAKYLGNHDPVEVLTNDGRQAMFRKEAVTDFGFDSFDDHSDGAVALKLRFDAPDPQVVGIPLRDEESADGEFGGGAEIYSVGETGSEVLLGAFDHTSGTWTPTVEGRRWLGEIDNGKGRIR